MNQSYLSALTPTLGSRVSTIPFEVSPQRAAAKKSLPLVLLDDLISPPLDTMEALRQILNRSFFAPASQADAKYQAMLNN